MTGAGQTASQPDGGRFVALDSLRGVAALGVVCYHTAATSGIGAAPWHINLNLFVDFFFVLSGFVIASAYGERLASGFSALRFMLLRAGRLYPVHLAMVLVYALAELAYALLGSPGGRAAFSGPRAPEMLPAVALLVQAYVYPGIDNWNVQSWSISVELGLYLLFAGSFVVIGQRARWLLGALSAAALLAILVNPEIYMPYGWIVRGIAGFGLGAVLWSLHGRLAARSTGAVVASLLELAALALLCLPFAADLTAGLGDLCFAATILVFARGQGVFSTLLNRRPFMVLGAVSYSLYMVHGFVLGRLFDVARMVQGRTGLILVDMASGRDRLAGSALQTNLLMALFLAISVVAAWVLWRLVENPSRLWSRRMAARFGVQGEERSAPAI